MPESHLKVIFYGNYFVYFQNSEKYQRSFQSDEVNEKTVPMYLHELVHELLALIVSASSEGSGESLLLYIQFRGS